MLWGLAWALMAYSLATIEFSVGFSLAFNIVSLLLLTALIAFYCEWRVFYSLSAPPLIFLLFEEHWVMVPSVTVHWLAVGGLLIILETGRRMLNRWFELAVSREYDNLMLARKMDAMAHRDPDRACQPPSFRSGLQARHRTGHNAGGAAHGDPAGCGFFKRYNDRYGHQAGMSA